MTPANRAATSGPTISIGLCTFNGERYLRDQLDSIESQTLLPYEVVACDDGSTDNTISLLHEFARRARFPVRVIQNKERLGVAANFAKAVSECRGDYYAPCDQDDVWLPERLEAFAALLRKHPYDLVFSDAFLLDETSRPLNRRVWQSFHVGRRELERIGAGRVLELLVDRTFVTGATMILSQNLLNIAFPLPPDLPNGILQDAWLVMVAAAREEIAAIPRPLMFYRRHATQQAGVPPDENVLQRIGSWLLLHREKRLIRQKRHREWIDATVLRGETLEQLLASRVTHSGKWRSLWSCALDQLRWRQRLSPSFLRRLFSVVYRAGRGAYSRYSARPFTDITRDILYGSSRSSSPDASKKPVASLS